MSDHPNPGNRYDYINREAELLHVTTARHDTQQFEQIRSHLRALPPAPTMEEVAKNPRAGRTGGSAPDSRPRTGNIPRPDSRTTTYNEGNLFRVSVPSNWRELPSSDSVTFAPEGAAGTIGGNSVFTHGVEIGVARNESHDLQTATNELLETLRQGNPRLSPRQGFDRVSIGGHPGLHTVAANVSDVTGGPEVVDISTASLSDGSLFYVLGVAPREDSSPYAGVFQAVVRSIQFER
jgi:hypothetical protein